MEKDFMNGDPNIHPRGSARRFDQNEFDGLWSLGTGANNTACHITSLLNEVSEEYTNQTGETLTMTQAINMLKSAKSNGSCDIYGNTGKDLYEKFLNSCWEITDLEGSRKLDPKDLSDSHRIFKTNRYGGSHFESSGYDNYSGTSGSCWDPYKGEWQSSIPKNSEVRSFRLTK